MRVIVCGGRDFYEKNRVFRVLDQLHEQQLIVLLANGGARGADTLAQLWAEANRVPTARYPAQWTLYGASAGPRRNAEMLRDVAPDLVLAFPGGRGTADMIEKSQRAGVTVEFG